MNSHDPDQLSPSKRSQTSAGPVQDRLDSWKEIAVYVRRGVRTVQRWERDSGLPVHRLNRAKRSVVFAYRSEIDAWWAAQCTASAADGLPIETHATRTSESLDKEPGAHRWFIASPGLF